MASGFWGSARGRFPLLLAESLGVMLDLAPRMLESQGLRICEEEVCVAPKSLRGERRRWARLPLAIPVFVRSRDDKGKEVLEFATALNVSAGGMLVAVRRLVPSSPQILLEIPSAPLAALAALPAASRNLRARALRSSHAEGYYLLGLKFSRPLLNQHASIAVRRRKLASAK